MSDEVTDLRSAPGIRFVDTASTATVTVGFKDTPRDTPKDTPAGELRYVTIPVPVEGGAAFDWTVDGKRYNFTAPAGASSGEEHEFTFREVEGGEQAPSQPKLRGSVFAPSAGC